MAESRESLIGRLSRLASRPEADGASDDALLGRFLAGRDEAAFAALVERHGPLVLNVCRRVLGDAHDAEDAFQATFLVLARKADTVHPREALAAWLHGVACRVALKARAARARRSRADGTAPGPAKAQPDPLAELSARELLELVDAEVRRLPEVYRLPVILCCLEGRTQEEAARLLGWTAGSVKGRLERGRVRLHDRLARRGLTLSAALVAVELSRGVGSAAVAERAAVTVAAALAFATGQAGESRISAQSFALARAVTRGMALTRLQAPAALLLSVCLLAAGLAAHRAADPPRPTAPTVRSSPPPALEVGPLPAAPQDEAAGPWPEAATRPIRVSGRVLDPTGRPFAGARVYIGYAPRRCDLSTPRPADFPARGTSGTDGRFAFAFAKSDLDERCLNTSRPVVVAAADGFGLAWAEVAEPTPIDLRLTEDRPVEGRVTDPAGTPVAGVRVFVQEVSSSLAGGMPAAVTAGDYSSVRTCRGPLPGLPAYVTTAADGRFRLTGLGRERLVVLALEGLGIAPTELTVATTAVPPRGARGAEFDCAVHPSRPIRGVVRDKATGRPVAGVRMTLDMPGPPAVTDDGGRYELHGRRVSSHVVTAQPWHGTPYFAGSAFLPATPGDEPLTADFDLVGGPLLRGRVTDRTTGQPPRRAAVVYYPLSANPRGAAVTTLIGAPSTAPVRPDGSYTLTVLPGPGVVLVTTSPRDEYASVRLDGPDLTDLLGGTDPGGASVRIAARGPSDRRALERYHAIALIDPDGRTEPQPLDLTVEPARAVRGRVAGPDGTPLSGVRVTGLTAAHDTEALEGASFTVAGLNPRGARELSFHHPEQGLFKVVIVRGDEPGPVTVRLDPVGVITGRAVDRAGRPVSGATVTFSRGATGPEVTARTDRDGRFRSYLVAGQPYSLVSNPRRLSDPAAPVAVDRGGIKDLGDVSLDR